MTETSPEFHKLNLALATAEKLIADLPDHKIRNDVDELKLRSYVFLMHAAIEEYLETVSLYVCERSLENFHSINKFTQPLFCAISYYSINYKDRTYSFSGPTRYSDELRFVFEKTMELHRLSISQNNGIKIKHQNSLFFPIGFCIQDYDNVLSQMLNTIGSRRGKIAHNFGIVSKHPKAALITETATVLNLIQGLDNELCRRTYITYH